MSASPTLERPTALASKAAHDAAHGSFRARVVSPVYRALMRRIPENRMGDRLYSCIAFFKAHKRLPTQAMRYNDVLYRIKTGAEMLDPLRAFVSDKEFVKLYVKAMVGDHYNVPTLDVIRRVEDVETYDFPHSCCIKPTHLSGRVVFRTNGEPVAREKIRSWFSMNHYRLNREVNYKHLEPKAIVEPLIFGSTNVEDYKIFCVNGAPRLVQVDLDRHIAHKRKYFDPEWNDLNFSIKYPHADRAAPRPGNLAEMLRVAAALSRNFWFVRIDLYSDGKQLLVGEITHCADNADGGFSPKAAEVAVSDYLFRDASPPLIGASRPRPEGD
jgi:hypothetical protein